MFISSSFLFSSSSHPCSSLLLFLSSLVLGDGVHLVDGHDELLDAKGVDEQGVLPGLPVLGDTGLGELHELHSGGVQVLSRSAQGMLVWDRDVSERVSSPRYI